MRRLFVSREFLDSALNRGPNNKTVSPDDQRAIAEEQLRVWQDRADRHDDTLVNAGIILSLGVIGGVISFRVAADPKVNNVLFGVYQGVGGVISWGNAIIFIFALALFLNMTSVIVARYYAIPHLKKWLFAVRRGNPNEEDTSNYYKWQSGRNWVNRLSSIGQIMLILGSALIIGLIWQISQMEYAPV